MRIGDCSLSFDVFRQLIDLRSPHSVVRWYAMDQNHCGPSSDFLHVQLNAIYLYCVYDCSSLVTCFQLLSHE